jgi:hypothetical protein
MTIAGPFARALARASIGAALAVAAIACSQSSLNGGGSGGASSSGGATESGGAVSSGGSLGNGGAGGSSSSTGDGGAGGGGSGGALSAGGNTAGGSSGSGGASAGGNVGSGGKVGSGGAPGGASGTGGKVGGATGTGVGGVAGGATGTGVGADGTSGGNTGTNVGGAGGGTSNSVDCTDISTTKLSFTKQYQGGSLAVTGSTKTYYSNSNWWHKFGGQTIDLQGLSMKIGNSQGASVPASDGNPMGFPTIFIGAYSGNETVGSNLPKQVSAIKSVPTVFETNASTLDTSNLNATYDVWFTASGGKLTSAMQNNPGKGGAYLMVWMFKPKERQPRGGIVDSKGIGTPNYPATTIDGVSGNWDVWVDPSDPLCISYVSSTPVDGLSFDLNKFIQDSVNKKYGITSSMYLNIVFAGTEIWSGGDGLEIKQFCAAVN